MKLTKDQKAIYEYEGVTFFSPYKGSKLTYKRIEKFRSNIDFESQVFVCPVGGISFTFIVHMHELIAVKDLEKYVAHLENNEPDFDPDMKKTQLLHLKRVIKRIGKDKSFHGWVILT